MKEQFPVVVQSKCRTLVIAAAVLGLVGNAPLAHAGFSLGGGADYAILYEGAGAHNFIVNSSATLDYVISGNVGIGDLHNPGTSPQVQLNNGVTINGNLDFAGPLNTQYSGTGFGGGPHVTGSTSPNVSAVDTSLTYLNTLSSSLGAETGTHITLNIANNQTQTIDAGSGTLDGGGNRLFTVDSMNFVNGATLTINGSASDYVVLNFNFNTHFGGRINLTGGITSDKVLFNVIGGMNLAGGDTLQTPANNVDQNVTYLDPNGTITINSVTIHGRIFGGDSTDMQIGSAGVIAPVPEPGPAALLAAAVGLWGLWGLIRRRVRGR